MKKLLLLCLLLSSSLYAQQKAVTVLVKQHDNAGESVDVSPYGKDDLSYGLYLDIFDGMGGWRMGASYATDLTGPGEADMVVTPEITLMGADKLFETGFSLMIDYIDAEVTKGWGDLYFQISMGLNIPLGNRAKMGIAAFFPFSDWDSFTDFDTGELNWGVNLSYNF